MRFSPRSLWRRYVGVMENGKRIRYVRTEGELRQWAEKRRARGTTVRMGPDVDGRYWWTKNGSPWEIGE